MKSQISHAVDAIKEELLGINLYLYSNPELGYKEYLACEKLTSYLKNRGFCIEKNISGLPTAFRAIYDSGKPGASIAFICEYDALPEVGHGCGHNMVSAMSIGAATGLIDVVNEYGGKIFVFGTPAEETDGGKTIMVESGVFDEIDFCFLLHPGKQSEESGEMLAMDSWRFDFHGKSAHASTSPEEGINALDCVIHLFNGINSFRQFIKDDVRIHGIICDGGKAPNVIPDFASAKFYVRADSRAYLNEINKHIFSIAEGAAKMTGAAVKISSYENSYDNLKSNSVMSKIWRNNMHELGFDEIFPPTKTMGSSDVGNVSQRVPTIHPYIDMGDSSLVWHTKEMADSTITEIGHSRIISGAKSLAFTGFELLSDNKLAQEVRNEFSRVR